MASPLDLRHLHLLLTSLQQQHQAAGSLIHFLRSLFPSSSSSSPSFSPFTSSLLPTSSSVPSLPLHSQWIKRPHIPLSPPRFTITILTPADPRWIGKQNKSSSSFSSSSGSSCSSPPPSSSSSPSTSSAALLSPTMDLERNRSSSLSGSSSSSSAAVSGSIQDFPLEAHANISSITNPSLSGVSHSSKRKLSDVASADEAQLPQPSVAQRGDLNGSSSKQTMELRADAAAGSGSESEEELDRESLDGSVVDDKCKIRKGLNNKKMSKRQKRKTKVQNLNKTEAINQVRGVWDDFKRVHKLFTKAGDDLILFDEMRQLKMRGETQVEFRAGSLEAQRRFDALDDRMMECEQRLAHLLKSHSSILRPKKGIMESRTDDYGDFNDEFEIL